MERTLLLVDDEPNILRSLKRLLRRGGYRILTAESGREGLELLEKNDVQVIVSDARMPEMGGIEFLDKARERQPSCIRIMLSGYTDLEAVIQAVNRSAIYKFLPKPWDDDLLQDHIDEAFRQYELAAENSRLSLELQAANEELALINQNLEKRVQENVRQSMLNLATLKVAQDVLEHLPLGVIGISEENLIAVANRRALDLFNEGKSGLVGCMADTVLPAEVLENCCVVGQDPEAGCWSLTLAGGRAVKVQCNRIKGGSGANARVLVFLEQEGKAL